jgi:hypothetical protein
MTLCLDAKHAEAAVVVEEGDALYDAGDFLGRGSALWHSGVHEWGFIIHFATDGWGMGDLSGSRLWMDLAAGRIRVGVRVSNAG